MGADPAPAEEILGRGALPTYGGGQCAERTEIIPSSLGGVMSEPPPSPVVGRNTPAAMPEESTTPDPAELTRRAFEAVNQRDIDAVMSFFAPHAVLDGRAVGGVYEGRAAIRGFLDDWFGSFTELRMEVEEFVVLDDGVVLAVVNQEGRPVGVDGQVHQREGWAICWSADGLLVRLTTNTDINEVRAAANGSPSRGGRREFR
jgi:ketosteroid isomerase-like protein